MVKSWSSRFRSNLCVSFCVPWCLLLLSVIFFSSFFFTLSFLKRTARVHFTWPSFTIVAPRWRCVPPRVIIAAGSDQCMLGGRPLLSSLTRFFVTTSFPPFFFTLFYFTHSLFLSQSVSYSRQNKKCYKKNQRNLEKINKQDKKKLKKRHASCQRLFSSFLISLYTFVCTWKERNTKYKIRINKWKKK